MDTSPIVCDIETVGRARLAEILDPVEADKRLTDPKKIAADLIEKEKARLDKASLDPNTNRIVALGRWTEQDGYIVDCCESEDEEANVLEMFWEEAEHRTIVGFNILGFDLKTLVQHSRFLDVSHPQIDFSKYARRGVHDLYMDLTFNEGHHDQGVMRRSLKAFCRRFGITCTDTIEGKDIPALVAAGNWDAVIAHCRSDLAMTVQLAQRLGLIPRHLPVLDADGTPARL